jgi:hypothetical protein
MLSSAIRTDLAQAASPALRLLPATVPPGPVRPARPELRVIEGGRAPGRLAAQAAYRRRRVLALVGLLVAVACTFLLADAIASRLADGGVPSTAVGELTPTSADASGAAGVAAPPEVVVQPGDTLWSIASAVAPDRDVRITVDELVRLNGNQPIVVGQRLALPA